MTRGGSIAPTHRNFILKSAVITNPTLSTDGLLSNREKMLHNTLTDSHSVAWWNLYRLFSLLLGLNIPKTFTALLQLINKHTWLYFSISFPAKRGCRNTNQEWAEFLALAARGTVAGFPWRAEDYSRPGQGSRTVGQSVRGWDTGLDWRAAKRRITLCIKRQRSAVLVKKREGLWCNWAHPKNYEFFLKAHFHLAEWVQ